mmetsp:Transcript_2507/g.7503  ORF Transcript_2507/g.7503 Transcript_2507/m.7503 type:complete len:212 (+) Transcript_2507:2118-2753(+)
MRRQRLLVFSRLHHFGVGPNHPLANFCLSLHLSKEVVVGTKAAIDSPVNGRQALLKHLCIYNSPERTPSAVHNGYDSRVLVSPDELDGDMLVQNEVLQVLLRFGVKRLPWTSIEGALWGIHTGQPDANAVVELVPEGECIKLHGVDLVSVQKQKLWLVYHDKIISVRNGHHPAAERLAMFVHPGRNAAHIWDSSYPPLHCPHRTQDRNHCL